MVQKDITIHSEQSLCSYVFDLIMLAWYQATHGRWYVRKVMAMLKTVGILMVAGFLMIGETWANDQADAERAPDQQMLEEQLEAAHERLDQIDRRMSRLEYEQEMSQAQARDAHRGRFAAHQRIMAEDEELVELQQQIAELERQTAELRAELSKRLSEHSEYQAQRTTQQNAIDHMAQVNQEVYRLADDRVQVQLEIQALERQLEEVLSEQAEGNTITIEEQDS